MDNRTGHNAHLADTPAPPPPPKRQGAKTHVAPYVWLSVALVFAILLYFLNPTDYVLMPKCPFKLLTGYDCPGCGFQRATHALLHGDVLGSLRFNPFLLFAVPYVVALMISDWLLRGERAKRWQRVTHHPALLTTYLVLFFVWWVVRNLPGFSMPF